MLATTSRWRTFRQWPRPSAAEVERRRRSFPELRRRSKLPLRQSTAPPEGEEIRMEDVLGKGTRKRPSAATEDVDELQAETRRF